MRVLKPCTIDVSSVTWTNVTNAETNILALYFQHKIATCETKRATFLPNWHLLSNENRKPSRNTSTIREIACLCLQFLIHTHLNLWHLHCNTSRVISWGYWCCIRLNYSKEYLWCGIIYLFFFNPFVLPNAIRIIHSYE